MRIGYIILAHTGPEHLIRLVRRLDAASAAFFVHVDRRAPDAVFEPVRDALAAMPNASLLERRPVHWASFSQLRASLDGVEALLAWPEQLDYGVLLTGQDYPLRPPREIADTLDAAEGRSFITFRPASGRFRRRVTRRHWHGNVLGRRVRLPNRFMPLTVPRSLPAGLEPFHGSAHWCLSRACLEHVAALIAREPDALDSFRRASSPDESFFQTILAASPLSATLVNDDLRYVDWSDGGPSPRVLTSWDLDRMLRCGALFARKFDPRVDAEVLDQLDARIDGEA